MVLPIATAAIFFSAVLVLTGQAQDAADLLKKADEQFEKKNYKDAAQSYERFIGKEPGHAKAHDAHRRLMVCNLRLQLFDPAIETAERYVAFTKGSHLEARAQRLLGNLYLTIPHWGTRAGGKFHRAQWKQGVRLRSERHDKSRAFAALERARELYAQFDSGDALPEKERSAWHEERIECIFDLAAACARFGIYENEWRFWYGYWGQRDEFTATSAGEADFDEYYGAWQLRRKRPIGLRVDPAGEPIFPTAPKAYGADLSDDQRILYLLAEARNLDRTKDHRYAALSWYRQAMLSRSRFGMDRLNSYAGMYWWGGRHPLQDDLKAFNPWELGDSETLLLAGGKIRKVKLPRDWDVIGLLRMVFGDYRDSGLAPEAKYSLGLYHQSRQQYKTALGEYHALRKRHADDNWAKNAKTQIDRILLPQVRISQAGLQLPGGPAGLQLSYRNSGKIWFVAREIFHEGFLRYLRNQEVDRYKGLPHWWTLRNWHQPFALARNERSEIQNIAAKFVGPEVARWADEVTNDGTHRYAQATLQSPLQKPGAYLIYAYLSEPPADLKTKTGADALGIGDSRAVLALTDLAIVEKNVAKGNLYFICDARTGAPIPQATIRGLEVWSVWDRSKRKRIYSSEMHRVRTDKKGTAVLEFPRRSRGQMHLLVTAGEGDAKRLAWSGMHYWNPYSKSRMRDGLFAYCITDRPVYRPNQTVRYKVWVRHMEDGQLENAPDRTVSISIRDVRGNKVLETRKTTDQFGGLDGELKLGEEPALGLYRLTVHDRRWSGGQTFRVEEYKKPEFEVSVEPGATHAKLGDKVEARIKATYYFGGPVTEASVKYKIFREEYRHQYYFPSAWDWLYGPGYGFAWYDYPWFGWWGAVRVCRVAPVWWWSWYGGAAPNPVRELVLQGEGPIGEDGTLKLSIDTAPALRDHPDRDHRYVVQAEVRDASRRVISGEGAVKVTRQAYYAMLRSDRGYYRPGEEMRIKIACLTPENRPVKTEGVITVSEVVFGGPDNARLDETELKRWTASTDERGLLEFQLRHEKSGQLKIQFEAPDAWGGVVKGYLLVWVCGRDFDGRLYRFNDLELITDKRTYKPGQVAHVLINTRQSNSYVLYSDQLDNNTLLDWKLLYLPKRTMVMDIPIRKEHGPNFFIEATTVAATRVHQQSKRICVPPEKGILTVEVQSDKAEYQPGERAKVSVKAKTLQGEPAQAQITLSAFDKSVLYIQQELTQPIANFFYGRQRRHTMRMQTNLYEQFSAWGNVHRPFQHLYPYPPAWHGIWGPTVRDWRIFGDAMLDEMAEGGAELRSGIAGRGGGRGAAAQKSKKSEASGPRAPPSESEALDRDAGEDFEAGGEEPTLVEAEVRKRFADTAVWLTTLTTDEKGEASASFEMPENLTTWKMNAWGMTKETRVGQDSTSAITTKNLIVRLQAPRFFMELDEVVLSANVHNYLETAKKARVEIELPSELLQRIGNTDTALDVEVEAGGETRVDWRVKVLKEGVARITVKALTDQESDAMQMSFPVLVHGMTKQVATTGSMRPGEVERTITVQLEVPEKRRPELTRLEVQYAPSLVGAMLDALPYCLDYPYGCTEQTMSRFLPAVLTLNTLQKMGVSLEDLRKIRAGRMEEIRRVEKGERIKIYGTYADSPIFDEAEMKRIIAKGLARIANMHRSDGGWGWWATSQSNGYMTSYVLYALMTARQCDMTVPAPLVSRGMNYLKGWEQRSLQSVNWSPHARHAFSAYVLSMAGERAAIKPGEEDKRPGDLIERLWLGRDKLSLYGKALLSLALANLKDEDRATTVLENILQYKQENAETQVAWFRTPRGGWWYWWNSDIETNAWILRALVRLQPKSDLAPRVVKWLLNNRRNGYYWRSTRDTTLCVAAMSDFVNASGEGTPDFTLRLDLDNGAVVKEVKIHKDNFFTFDNRFVVEGVALDGGRHTLKISKSGPGALYFNTYLRFFTKEEDIKAAGHELKVDRTYFRLEQIPYEVEVEGARGQTLKEKRLRYKRVPIHNGDTLKSGAILQVELKVSSDNNYTYLAFEDMKPAGCEPVQVRSGGKGQEGFYSYMELRDEKTVFFVGSIEQGEHLLRYRLRAEIPGVFHALPTRLFAMYVPELRANSDEILIRIID
jgi:uncharacterized protein YfaS (alpha-2-macroglobulin family)/outer membrane protein assembly factor BamD (BamD/ComL family)